MSIKVAIIGCGSIAEFRHAPEYYENPNVVIAGFYDKHYERAEKLAKKFGGKVYLNLEEIMKDETINAISDCTSNETHVLVSTEALNHGKHVLCEKPIATTLEDAEKILNAVEKSNKIFMVDYNQRLADAHKKAKEILKTGELGKVLTFSTTFGHKGPEYWSATKGNSTWFFKKNRSVLGVAADLGIHKIDLLRYILDDEFDEVFAFEAVLDKKDEFNNPIEVCDNFICLLKTKKGVLGTGTFSWTYYGDEDNSTILYCQKGILKIYDNPEFPIIIDKGKEKVYYRLDSIQTNENQTKSGVIDEFVNCIIKGSKPFATVYDGVAALKVIIKAMESARTGNKIKIV